MRQSRMDTDLETMDLDQGGEVGVRPPRLRRMELLGSAHSLPMCVFPCPRLWLRGRFST